MTVDARAMGEALRARFSSSDAGATGCAAPGLSQVDLSCSALVSFFLSLPHWGFVKRSRVSPGIAPGVSRAGVAELVDAPDLGSGAFGVGVRVPSPAPFI